MQEEVIEIVDREGSTIGLRNRSEVHGNPSLLHKVVHILVFNDSGELLLQKRSRNKDAEPGKWDSSVGGHVSPGEDFKAAALREMKEELGIVSNDIELLYSHIYSSNYESELVVTYKCFHNGPFPFNREEIDDVAFWAIAAIERVVGSGILSATFEAELHKLISERIK